MYLTWWSSYFSNSTGPSVTSEVGGRYLARDLPFWKQRSTCMHEMVEYGKLQFASVIKVLLARSFLLSIPLALAMQCGCDLGGYEVSRRDGRGVIYLTPLSTSKLCPGGVGGTLSWVWTWICECVEEEHHVSDRRVGSEMDGSANFWVGFVGQAFFPSSIM